MVRRSLFAVAVRSVSSFVSPVLLALTLASSVGLAQTFYYVNGATGRDDCHTGLAPVPTDLCPFPPEPASVDGPFRTITRAAQAAANPASGTPVTIMVAGATSGGSPVVYNAALGEVFAIYIPPATTIMYDAANSTPGTLVTIDGGGAWAVLEFGGEGFPLSGPARGIDGSTLGASVQAITVRGGDIGIVISAVGSTAGNNIRVKNVRVMNNTIYGIHVLAENGQGSSFAQSFPTLDTCLFTQDTSSGVIKEAHLRIEADDVGWCYPTVFNCLFRVEPDPSGAVPRVARGIWMSAGVNNSRVAGTFIANIVDGLSNWCTGCSPGCVTRGIDFGVVAETYQGAGASSPTFTTCWFQNCGVIGFLANAIGGGFSPTFSNCNFLFNGKHRFCGSLGVLDPLRGAGAGLGTTGGALTADFQYCLAGGNNGSGFHCRIQGSSPSTTNYVRFLTSQSAYNSDEGIFLDVRNGLMLGWSGGGPSILNTKTDHNGYAGLRLEQFSGISFDGAFASNFVVSNFLTVRNQRGVLLRFDTFNPSPPFPNMPVKLNFITAARNQLEGIRGENLFTGGSNLLPEIENVTARSNFNGTAAPGGPYDVTGITDVRLRWANIAGAFPTFPNFCPWPNPYMGGSDPNSSNLWCDPLFVNETADDYHLVADEFFSKSLDTGKNSPIGGAPTTDLEGVNNRVIDFMMNGPNGNFPGNWADRGCYERP
jgi:hypothetical protein